MCIGGQPKAPINKPNYEPEDAYKHFVSKIKKPDGTEETLTPPQARPSVPSVNPSQKTIRM